jgi:hypothetical protein
MVPQLSLGLRESLAFLLLAAARRLSPDDLSVLCWQRRRAGLTPRCDGADYIRLRSGSLEGLANRHASMAFAQELWPEILKAWTPPILITIARIGLVLPTQSRR